MALTLSTAVRNAVLDAIEAAIGTSAVLKIWDGAMPSTPDDADVGVELASMSLSSDWMAAASGGSKSKSGTWQDASASVSGTAQYFRIYASDGTTCGLQGTVTATGGGGDIALSSTSITAGQAVEVTAFTLTAAGGVVFSHRTVTYTATGSEGTDFMVSIGATLSSDSYTVLWSPRGVVESVPIIDLPNSAGSDRTTTQFRVTAASDLTAGDVLVFVILE